MKNRYIVCIEQGYSEVRYDFGENSVNSINFATSAFNTYVKEFDSDGKERKFKVVIEVLKGEENEKPDTDTERA